MKGSTYKYAHHTSPGDSISEERLQTPAIPHRRASTVANAHTTCRRTPPTPFKEHRHDQPSTAIIALLGFQLQNYTAINLCDKVSRLHLVVAGNSYHHLAQNYTDTWLTCDVTGECSSGNSRMRLQVPFLTRID